MDKNCSFILAIITYDNINQTKKHINIKDKTNVSSCKLIDWKHVTEIIRTKEEEIEDLKRRMEDHVGKHMDSFVFTSVTHIFEM